MIVYKVLNNGDRYSVFEKLTVIRGGLYCFTKKKIAERYKRKFIAPIFKPIIVKLWATGKVKRKRYWPEERVFEKAIILKKY